VEHLRQFYINGTWVDPHGSSTHEVIDPSRETPVATLALGDEHDVDVAVGAARRAFASFSATSRDERLDLLEAVIAVYRSRAKDLEEAVSLEMGAPSSLAHDAHVPAGLNQFVQAAAALRAFDFEERHGTTAILHEPVGVCGLITPWNWPLLLIGAKVAPALAAGCTMVLKPSEFAPLNALLVAEILHEAGVPAGVFNLINGTGPVVGAALSRHREVDMISITGSTRAGVEVARNAASTVKRVHQELGGKSANIILDDADLAHVLARDVVAVMENSGQSCDAGSRILVPEARLREAEEIAARAAASIVVGAPEDPRTVIGPVVSRPQFEKVQRLIHSALSQGANLVAGGLGRPAGIDVGYYVRPTVLSHVTNDMTIAREEIFGPVVTLMTYRDEDDAIRIANDSDFGLSGYVSSADTERARRVARQIRSGMMHVNGAHLDGVSPFGGYKQSGNGREYGAYGLRDFLEVKSVFGYYD
jgi:aldehyde dehydrogenase (NAD+)